MDYYQSVSVDDNADVRILREDSLMRYGVLLELRAIPEWREHFLSYKKLKRLLDPLKRREPDDVEQGGGLDERLLDEHSATRARVEADFLQLLDEDIVRVNAHTARVARQLEERVALLLQQHASSVVKPSPYSGAYNRSVSRLEDDEAIEEVYSECAKLKAFVQLNREGIRKIVKKLDKHLGGPIRQTGMISRLQEEAFVRDGKRVEELSNSLESVVSADQLMRMQQAALYAVTPSSTPTQPFKLWAIGVAAFAASCVAFLPELSLGRDHVHEQRCLSVIVGVIIMWLTQALAYFVTALLVPALVVLCRVIPLRAKDGADSMYREAHGLTPLDLAEGSMSAQDSAKLLLSAMFDHLILLVLAGLTAAAVVSRCQLEFRLALFLHRNLSHRPLLFCLVIMQLGLVVSLCISNVTAPILLLSALQPTLRELPPGCAYARFLTLGLAFACNLGGMLTPIASPQNAVALGALLAFGKDVTFGSWLAAAFPVAQLGLVAVFGLLVLLLQPFDVSSLPSLYLEEKRKLTTTHIVMLLTVFTTLLLWAGLSFPSLTNTFGDPAIVGLFFIAVPFGSGFLTKEDFNGLAWHLLALIAGGNALGVAASRSGLLSLTAQAMTTAFVDSSSPWLLTGELALGVLLITTFFSHTVAAIVIMPLAASMGASGGVSAQVVFCCALACSAAMALPMSSFPNVNSLLAEDDYGRTYVRATDFVLVGFPAQLLVTFIVMTLGYFMSVLLL